MTIKQRNQYIISVMAADRVGIIHDITRVISELGGDLTDTRQQVLQGYFSMILYSSFSDDVKRETIRDRLLEIEPEHPFTIAIHPVMPEKQPPAPDPETSYVLTARGDDRIGFVSLVSGFCRDHRINILDLSTTGQGATYTMILMVDLSGCDSMETLRKALKEFEGKHDLSLLLQHRDIFLATNEIRMI